MPRKENGFGGNMSFAFKTKVSKSIGNIRNTSGDYPRNRTFGSVVTRTPVDKFNLDATWSKWRKGYEYFTKQKWVPFDLQGLRAEIFPSFRNTLTVNFSATRFPTSLADDATHYVLERVLDPHEPFAKCQGKLTQLGDYSLLDVQNHYDERWELLTFQGQGEILKLEAETLTTKENYVDTSLNTNKKKTTNAIVKSLLTVDTSYPDELVNDKVVPAVYTGSSRSQGTNLTVRATEVFGYDGIAGVVDPLTDDELQALTGKQISLFDANPFYNIDPREHIFEEIDENQFQVKIKFRGSYAATPCRFFIYDAKPFSDDEGIIYQRDFQAIGVQANFGGEGEFVFNKKTYQRWFKSEFNAQALEQLAENIAPLIPTAMTIQSISRVNTLEADENVLIELVPFTSQILYTKRPFNIAGSSDAFYVMSNPKKSFTQEFNTLEDGTNKILETKLNINIDPDMDETFTTGESLWLANRFSCDCPSYSKAVLRAPEQRYEENTLTANRQRKYPLPTAGSNRSKATIDNANDNAGIFNTWISDKDREVFQCCKHTISAYFEKGIKVLEPNQVPIYRDLERAEEKISLEIEGAISSESIKRAEVSSIGFVWAVVQLLVQSTAAIIADPNSRTSFLLKPIEHFYGFKKARRLVPTAQTFYDEDLLFKPKDDNIVEL